MYNTAVRFHSLFYILMSHFYIFKVFFEKRINEFICVLNYN